MKFKAVIFWLVIVSINLAQSKIIQDGDTYYFADRIIVKYKNSQPSLGKISNQFANKFGITEEIETYSNIKDESTESNELKKIRTLKFSSPFNPIYIIKEIKKQKNIEWAEPHYLYELTFDPNDPVYNYTGIDTLKFEHLDVIKAKQAWDINQGSEDVIIAIVDTGIDWLHEDLADNIWTNPGEVENNGIDDDGNGFIDDIKGWDFGGDSGIPDNDPNEDRADHGTHVAGLASAVTNNGIGIASIGFNTKLMAVKTSQNDLRNSQGIALIAFGYEGIQYAADNRANIISCSWGGYSYSFNAQAIIDYAVSKGSLVIAAAGNDNSKAKFYPASYDGVLSVAGTNFVDQKASWSNYGTKIDVAS
ncbi:MAG: S8 family serine peptidase, partial [Ignavibacteriae bacterium]|nr:S8 family serine peptidase [Ignavibacteriota bacterium]